MTQWNSPHGRKLPSFSERTLLMGILNVTPDSFSDGGQLSSVEAALGKAQKMIEEGADVLDIGGESTRPGSAPVEASEEIARVLPAIRAIRQRFPEVPLSIDTYKATVADEALAAGVDLINDIWGFRYGVDEKADSPASPMAEVAARWNCPAILMHNRLSTNYTSFWEEVLADLSFSVQLARQAGLPENQIWLDPGFGFGKGVPENLEILRHLDRIVALGFPILLGTSRKSTIGHVLNRAVEERAEGTATTHVWGISRGCQMIRVHEIASNRLFVQMADAIKAGLNYPDPGTK